MYNRLSHSANSDTLNLFCGCPKLSVEGDLNAYLDTGRDVKDITNDQIQSNKGE